MNCGDSFQSFPTPEDAPHRLALQVIRITARVGGQALQEQKLLSFVPAQPFDRFGSWEKP